MDFSGYVTNSDIDITSARHQSMKKHINYRMSADLTSNMWAHYEQRDSIHIYTIAFVVTLLRGI